MWAIQVMSFSTLNKDLNYFLESAGILTSNYPDDAILLNLRAIKEEN
jgi:hypothetical protein